MKEVPWIDGNPLLVNLVAVTDYGDPSNPTPLVAEPDPWNVTLDCLVLDPDRYGKLSAAASSGATTIVMSAADHARFEDGDLILIVQNTNTRYLGTLTDAAAGTISPALTANVSAGHRVIRRLTGEIDGAAYGTSTAVLSSIAWGWYTNVAATAVARTDRRIGKRLLVEAYLTAGSLGAFLHEAWYVRVQTAPQPIIWRRGNQMSLDIRAPLDLSGAGNPGIPTAFPADGVMAAYIFDPATKTECSAASATAVQTVISSAGFAAGDAVELQTDAGTRHVTQILTVDSATQVTLLAAPASTTGVGCRLIKKLGGTPVTAGVAYGTPAVNSDALWGWKAEFLPAYTTVLLTRMLGEATLDSATTGAHLEMSWDIRVVEPSLTRP